MRVLVIEDSQTQSQVIAKALKNIGCDAVVKPSLGVAASEFAQRPDFVFMDRCINDTDENWESAVNMLIDMRIPFTILTSSPNSVPGKFREYVVEKARNLGELVCSLLPKASEDVEID